MNPPQWTCRVLPNRVEIRPRYGTLTVVASIVCLFIPAIGIAFLLSSTHILISVLIMIFGILPMEALMLTVLTKSLKDQRAGPYLVCTLSDGTVRLPREGVTVQRRDMLGLRVVSGNWIGGAESQQKVEHALSELQLVARTAEGATAYLVVGWYWGDPMTETLRKFNDATGIPVDILNQPNVTTRVSSTGPDWS